MVLLVLFLSYVFFSVTIVLYFIITANAKDTDLKDLLSELELMKKLKPHPNVIKLLGCVTESGEFRIIITTTSDPSSSDNNDNDKQPQQ